MSFSVFIDKERGMEIRKKEKKGEKKEKRNWRGGREWRVRLCRRGGIIIIIFIRRG